MNDLCLTTFFPTQRKAKCLFLKENKNTVLSRCFQSVNRYFCVGLFEGLPKLGHFCIGGMRAVHNYGGFSEEAVFAFSYFSIPFLVVGRVLDCLAVLWRHRTGFRTQRKTQYQVVERYKLVSISVFM